ncbi:ImmA/IrrE family metallo-endopeptidase [Oceanicaulis sp.]|uniref:ImmA/IrrE family metallo-endopeptidase n=1 Tax=Oceanicaulis sp. TaxID=1924941 RepID=UPI003F6ED9BB
MDNALWSKVRSDDISVIEPFLTSTPVSMNKIAEALGIRVRGASLPAGVSGEIRPVNPGANEFIIRVNRHESKKRQRFTVGHELGHFLLHRELIGAGLTDNVLYRSGLSNKKETEANKIAADLLMPKSLLFSKLRNYTSDKRKLTLDERPSIVKFLAEDFMVSEDAMRIQLGWK